MVAVAAPRSGKVTELAPRPRVRMPSSVQPASWMESPTSGPARNVSEYGGSTEEGLKSGANHALQWQAIQWARERGCRLYDFWGVPDQLGLAAAAGDEAERALLEEQARSDPLYGVFRFKKGFGGRVVRYLPAYDRVYLPPLYALWQRRVSG